MKVFNSNSEYGLLAKLFHWITFIVLIAQVPFGFYLVGLEFSDERIELENIHILIGITVFYLKITINIIFRAKSICIHIYHVVRYVVPTQLEIINST